MHDEPNANDPVENVERYAFITVALSQLFVDRVQILAEAGLDIAAWARLRLAWKAKLLADANLARRYADATNRAQQRLDGGDSPLKVAQLEAPADWASGGESASIMRSEIPAVAGPPPNLVAHPVVLTSNRAELDVTGPLDVGRLGLDSLPFYPHATPAALAPPNEEPHPEMGATAFVDVAALGLDDPNPESDSDRAAASPDGTEFLDPSSLGDLDDPLPFNDAAPVVTPRRAYRLPHSAMGRTAVHATGGEQLPSIPFVAADRRDSQPPEQLMSDVKADRKDKGPPGASSVERRRQQIASYA